MTITAGPDRKLTPPGAVCLTSMATRYHDNHTSCYNKFLTVGEHSGIANSSQSIHDVYGYINRLVGCNFIPLSYNEPKETVAKTNMLRPQR